MRYEVIMGLAKKTAEKSLDPSTKVGCVILQGDQIVNKGWNGFPHRIEATEERLNNREIKYKIILHAEEMAILNAPNRFLCFDATAVVTHHPCAHCMAVLIEAGISKVVTPRNQGDYGERYRDNIALAQEIAAEAGVEIEFLEEPS